VLGLLAGSQEYVGAEAALGPTAASPQHQKPEAAVGAHRRISTGRVSATAAASVVHGESVLVQHAANENPQEVDGI
jgi:hypothetical protein